MITYSNPNKFTNAAIDDAGYSIAWNGTEFVPDNPANEAAIQSIIDTFDPLPDAKLDKIEELKAEAAKRCAEIYPHFGTNPTDVASHMQQMIDQYALILPAAQVALSGNPLAIKNIRDVYQSTVTQINAQTDWLAVMAYDVVNTPAWP